MNRENKFRSWDLQLKKMSKPFSFGQVLNFTDENGLGSIMTFDTTRHLLMYFMGLKDDNGVEIYEGDKVVDISGNTFHVEWNDDTCKFQFSDGSDLNDNERYSTYKIVIGNIYENPLSEG